ncbi:GAF domain-containing protein [Kovacikia minuta CCNUW1]|uniref:GAF domain-containing protein n=1 Tax=Kovacikia minuta TaxID=2931930 RepID=UPI001CCD09B2|nr:GAF domain-containing protein [Kovacikia minuta]UBF24712.1 GAF domain-containing protein [Kovacikia minuta CCNUW1]
MVHPLNPPSRNNNPGQSQFISPMDTMIPKSISQPVSEDNHFQTTDINGHHNTAPNVPPNNASTSPKQFEDHPFENSAAPTSPSLRRQLLTTILPWALVPLGVVGILSQVLTGQSNDQQTEKNLENQSLTASRAIENAVKTVKAIPAMVAPDPAVVEFSRSTANEVEQSGLSRLSPAEAAAALAANNPLPANRSLDNYLKRIVDTRQLTELLITEQHGFQIAASRPSADLVKQDETWWQTVKKQGSAIEPMLDASGKVTGINIGQAITDPSSNQFLGAVRGRLSLTDLGKTLDLLKTTLTGSQQMQLLSLTDRGMKSIATLTADGQNKPVEVAGGEAVAQKAAALIAQLNNTQASSGKTDLPTHSITDANGNRILLTSFSQNGRQYTLATIPNTNWVAVASIAQSEIGITGQNWVWIFASMILLATGFVALAVSRSARQISLPLSDLVQALEQISAGNMNVYVKPKGSGETQKLAQTFNGLVTHLKKVLQTQSEALNQAQFYADLAHFAALGDNQAVFNLAVQVAKSHLTADRMVIYSFEPDWSGTIVAEAVDPGWPKALRDRITDPCIPKQTLEQYRKGRFIATNDVQKSAYSAAHMQLLQRLEVKANLVVPIVSSDRLLGLIVAHQCSNPRVWQQADINFLRELATQIGLALTGVTLAAQRSADTERLRLLSKMVSNMRQSLKREDILRTAVNELREALSTDRVIVYWFNPDWSGTVIAESVGVAWKRILGETVNDPFREGLTEQYRNGRVRAMNDIAHENITDCHRDILDGFEIKANIVAPIVQNNQLLGLLCAHQCVGPRKWEDEEIDLFSQFATQLGFALEQAKLFTQQEEAAKRAHQLNEITFHMRESLDREQIFSTVVNDTREMLEADRAIVYLFDQDWKGTIVAESVGQKWPPALNANIADPCFARNYMEKYRKGRVQALSNIYEAKLDPCYMGQLEPFEVKANIVAPILAESELLGLLCVHQCSGSRLWQETEINFLRQVAIQLGFALDQTNLLKRQEEATKRARQLNEITFHLRDSFDHQQIFNAVTRETREALETDRVLIYLFDQSWQGTIVAESVGKGWPIALGANIADPCFAESYLEKYRRGRVHAITDINAAHLDPCYRGQLVPFEVKANIVAPILVEENLLGLLVAHQCSSPRPWQETEINFLKQVAIQLGFALEQANLFIQKEQVSQEQRQQKEALQLQLVELLSDVEGAASGDLTVHADVTAGEIGTVADFFNSIVENLRQIVTQVKQSALRVSASVGENEQSIRQLANEALKQVEETTLALNSVEEMTQSIQAVADRAQQAADVSRMAAATAETGGVAMDLTVQNILNLRETIGETAKKVKRLGESSQQISKVVSLINQIALQTNLLAINAGIEAARAGEQGQGFAVVAEEVGELAARSAVATQEIEQIVDAIQRETSEVVEAMELGTTQVVEGTRLVGDARQSLEHILEVSRQIDQLVQAISDTTVSQVQTSQAITSLMQEVAQVSGAHI